MPQRCPARTARTSQQPTAKTRSSLSDLANAADKSCNKRLRALEPSANREGEARGKEGVSLGRTSRWPPPRRKKKKKRQSGSRNPIPPKPPTGSMVHKACNSNLSAIQISRLFPPTTHTSGGAEATLHRIERLCIIYDGYRYYYTISLANETLDLALSLAVILESGAILPARMPSNRDG
jgi:hypothetical protein